MKKKPNKWMVSNRVAINVSPFALFFPSRSLQIRSEARIGSEVSGLLMRTIFKLQIAWAPLVGTNAKIKAIS